MTDCCVKIKISKPNYSVKVGGDTFKIKIGGNVVGVTNHGALNGLGNDDHPQYALSDGSRGEFGQTIDGQDLISIFNNELT